MTTTMLLVLGVLALGAAAWLTRSSQHRGAPPLVTLLLPLGLLFLAVPVPLVSLQVVEAFKAFTESGEIANRVFANQVAFALDQPLWHGSVMAVFVVMLATVGDRLRLRAAAARRHAQAETVAQPASAAVPATTNVRGWLAIISTALVVPVIGLAVFVGEVSPMLKTVASRLDPAAVAMEPDAASAESLNNWSTAIATRLVTGLLGGATVSVLLLLIVLLLMLTVRRATVGSRQALWARAAAALAAAGLAVQAALVGYRLYGG